MKKVYVLSILAFALFTTATIDAQEIKKEIDKWEYSIAPYVWATSISGDVGVRGRQRHVDVKFKDLWDDLDIAVMLEFEARKDRFGLYLNTFYVELEDRVRQVDVEMDMTIFEFGGFYRLFNRQFDSKCPDFDQDLNLDLYAGGRYTNVDVDFSRVLNLSRRRDWVDPLVGLRGQWQFAPKWTFAAAGDVGGFHAASDFTWQARGLLGYSITDCLQVFGGYRALAWDYDKGSGSQKFTWDVTMHGPLIGLLYKF